MNKYKNEITGETIKSASQIMAENRTPREWWIVPGRVSCDCIEDAPFTVACEVVHVREVLD